MVGKKGQFYILAALIILIILTGVFSVQNYSRVEQTSKLESIKKELQIERGYVVDYLLTKTNSHEERNRILTNFLINYSDYIGKDKSLYFIFGNRSNLSIIAYQDSNRLIKIISDNIERESFSSDGISYKNINPNSGEIIFLLDNFKYNFSLSENTLNFYFLIFQKKEDNRYIVWG
ncbi:MAG: hypothetical protein QXU40_01790 [Candidatus Pacearchaeota archaeon]